MTGRPFVGRQRRIAHEIRPLHAEAGERVEIGRLGDRDWDTGFQRDEGRHGPVIDESPEETGWVSRAPRARRYVPLTRMLVR
jgi:hypothetical protein